MSWGPFLPGIDEPERRARLRSLRTLLKVLIGPRGVDAGFAVLRAEISGGDPEMVQEAEAAFDRLGAIDRRRVLASFASLHTPNLKVVNG